MLKVTCAIQATYINSSFSVLSRQPSFDFLQVLQTHLHNACNLVINGGSFINAAQNFATHQINELPHSAISLTNSTIHYTYLHCENILWHLLNIVARSTHFKNVSFQLKNYLQRKRSAQLLDLFRHPEIYADFWSMSKFDATRLD